MKKNYIFLLLFITQLFAFSQEDAWVYFVDKENVAASIANPITILTQEAIDRKNNDGVVIDERDVPVNENYISQIKNATGITVFAKSKWFNAVHVRGTETDINNLETTFSFVDHIEFANKSLNTTRQTLQQNKFEIEESQVAFTYGNTQNQVDMINVDALHLADFTGNGVVVAVIDAGFPNVNTIGGFDRLRTAGNLLDGYDFVDRTDNVYAYTGNNHGTKVLSDMAGYIENQFVGTAPDASFYLFRTEDAGSENPVEESYWVEAAERADSLGVDIINTSLGYKNYDNPAYNHSDNDIDGSTTFITRGANIAFDKGLFLVNSAGNSGASGLNAPADAAGVFTIGSVDLNGNYSSFSSQGSAIQPTQKPDVVARGSQSFVIDSNNSIVQNNGTSFSSPILAGGVASLMQALSSSTNSELMQYIRESASQYTTPDYFLGYGIPNFELALDIGLSAETLKRTEFKIYPNPAKDYLEVSLPGTIEQADVLLFNVLGKLVLKSTVSQHNSVVNLQSISSGIYMIKFQTNTQKAKTFKLIIE